jgi:hypothetical protein
MDMDRRCNRWYIAMHVESWFGRQIGRGHDVARGRVGFRSLTQS